MSREVANLTGIKNPHTPMYGVKEFVSLSICLSVCYKFYIFPHQLKNNNLIKISLQVWVPEHSGGYVDYHHQLIALILLWFVIELLFKLTCVEYCNNGSVCYSLICIIDVEENNKSTIKLNWIISHLDFIWPHNLALNICYFVTQTKIWKKWNQNNSH